MKYIIGHKTPDVDSAVAAVSLSHLCDQLECMGNQNNKPALADQANKETKYVFDQFKKDIPEVLSADQVNEKDQFILVDHNEESQQSSAVKKNRIIEIYDHHKVNISLQKPIFITTKPWGSTNTIIWWLMDQFDIKPEKKIAGLMIAAILSDTVGLKSATTTKQDKKAVESLNKIALIKDLENFIFQIFKAKSDITGLSAKQILTKDYKIYNFGNKKVFINQIETVEQDKIIDQKDQILKELKQFKKDESIDQGYCLVTDILKINTKVITTEEEEQTLQKAFPKAASTQSGVWNIGAKMSRKKEVSPQLEQAIIQ
jgi:manganese-dependent inorganic pyrophosphatase